MGAAFDADALQLTDLFPEVPDGVAANGERLVAVAWGAGYWSTGLTLREAEAGLRLTCTYRTHWRPGPERGRTLTYAQVLDLIRVGRRVPTELELVFSPAEATGAWSLGRAERVVFGPGEWRLVGWRHWSENRIGQSLERMFRLGMEVSPGDPFIDLHFRLVPKVQNLGRKRLLGVRAVFDWASTLR